MEPSVLSDSTSRRVGKAIHDYQRARCRLVDLGVWRSARTLQGDYAEWLVARCLNLRLAPSGVQKGYDATDTRGRTYQIKSRVVVSIDASTSFDFSDASFQFDSLIGVFFTPSLEVLGIIEVSRTEAVRHSRRNKRSHRLRWGRGLLDEPWVKTLFRAKPRSSDRRARGGNSDDK